MAEAPALLELATAYHACRDVDTLLKVLAAKLGPRLDAQAVLVWVVSETGEEMVCRARWAEGGGFEPSEEPVTEGPVAEMLEATRARRLAAKEISPEAWVHLAENARARVKSALHVPIPGGRGVAGVVEALNKRAGEFTADDAAFAEEAARLTAPALDTLLAFEQERRSQLDTFERLTALYDISRIFNATLELHDLLPVVADKIRDILGAQACNLWLVTPEGTELNFVQQSGEDPTTTSESPAVPVGEGLLGEVAKAGQGRLVAAVAEEPQLAARRAAAGKFALESLMCAPLLKEEQVLGVVEVVNKLDGAPFDEDDLFFLSSISEQAALALSNANLLAAERKVRELGALLAISKEITSTLNLDRVLTTVVHQAATVVPFDKCAIGLFDGARFILGAVSGEAEVPKTPEMEQLRQALEWVAGQPEAVKADQYEEGWEVTPEEARERVVPHLEQRGANGFYALPLRDEQGVVGVLALLSGDAEFLSENHLEVLNILASQVTVAIRNARLYNEVPLMNLWQPLMERKQKLVQIPYGRWVEMGVRVGLVALILIVVPWKMRVVANATVVPAERRVVSAEVEGVVEQVMVHEGQAVAAGDVLAQLDDSNDRVKLARAEADLALAQRQVGEAEARRDSAAAAQARLRMQMHDAEVALYRERVQKARLRAPLAGVVVTPKVEEKVGRRLAQGEAFCEVVGQQEMAVEINVPETEIDLIQPGRPVAIKLNTFPADTFVGQVERMAAQTLSAEGEQFFVVRARFTNPEEKARTGMAGQAKITAGGGWFHSGWYPVGYVMIRTPLRWGFRKVWSWLP